MVSPHLPWSTPPRFKTCRYCFERIPGDAFVCPLCGETVVRVHPAMVKTLLIVLALALLIPTGRAIYHRLTDDPREIVNGEHTQGTAIGGEMGARQAALDFSRKIGPGPDDPPDQVGIFLRGKSEAFRKAFRQAYAEAYRRTYEEAGPTESVRP
jgi:hypothetical protein